MDNEIKALYHDFMRTKIFDAGFYARLAALAKKAAGYDTELCRTLVAVWEKTDVRKKYCFDSKRIRFNAVMGFMAALINH